MSKIKKFLRYWLPVIIWAVVIFILSAIPSLKVESLGFLDFIFRKIAHILEFLILAWFLFRAISFFSKERPWKIFLAVLAIGMFYAASDEYHQLYVAGREGSMIDAGIDSLGIILGTLAYYYFNFLKNKT